MLRWVLALLLLAIPGVGYIMWRTAELTAPRSTIIVAMPHGRTVALNLNDAADHLSQAIRQQTIAMRSGTPREPEVFTRFGDWMAATYPALHAVAPRETVGGYSYLYTWKGSDPSQPPIILIAHLDVSPAEAAERGAWKVEPFGGEQKDGFIWGRGALLGKSPLIGILEAANGLAKAGFKPRRTIYFAFGHDGEVRGQAGAAQIAALLKKRGVKAWFAIDEGLPIVAVHPFTNKPAAMIGVTEKRELDLYITSEGAPGASSISGRTQAVTTLAQALLALDSMPADAKVNDEPTLSMFEALAGDLPPERAFLVANAWAFGPLIAMQASRSTAGRDLLSTTTSPTVIAGGETQSLQPAAAAAIVNVRLHPRDTPEAFLARARYTVKGFPGVTVAWAEQPGPPIPIASDDSDAYHLIATLARQAAGGASAAPGLFIGSTDAHHYTGIAEDVYRFTPAIWTQDDIGAVQGVNERLSRENLQRMIGFYEGLLSEAAG